MPRRSCPSQPVTAALSAQRPWSGQVGKDDHEDGRSAPRVITGKDSHAGVVHAMSDQ